MDESAPSSPASAPSSNERVWAALAHGSIVLFSLSPVISLLVWMSNRERSKYAAFNALQAMSFQSAFPFTYLTTSVISMLLVFLYIFALLSSVNEMVSSDSPLVGLGFFVALFGPIAANFALTYLMGAAGVIYCLKGKTFRYPILGKWLEDFLASGEEKEDWIVAANCHAGAISFLWGLIFPLVAWFTQKDRSPALRLQALQAAGFQVIGSVLFVAMGFAYIILVFIMIFFFGMEGANGAASDSLLIGVSILMSFIFLGTVFYLIFAFIGTLRTLKGRDFRYPILGKLVARWMGYDKTDEGSGEVSP